MSSSLRRPAVALVAATLVAGVLGSAPAARAAGPGSVGGTVTTEGLEGIAPVEGVRVVAWAPGGDVWTAAGADVTDGTGAYRIANLAVGDYRIAFESTDGTYVSEVYDNATWDTATPVAVGEEAVTGVDADLELAGRITGTVEDEAGGALVDATVRTYVASPDETWVDSGIGAETDGLGAYVVAGLPAGSYRVEFSAAGYRTEVYEDVATVDEGSDVVVEAGWASELPAAVLTEGASVAGRVTDAAGDPLPDVEVSVTAAGSEGPPVDYATTEQDGSYVVDGLAADTYVVSFYSYQEAGEDLVEYYDDAGTLEEAAAVRLALGQDRAGVDAQLVTGEHDPSLPSFDNTAAPEISGTARVGSTLSASAGGWQPAPTGFFYSWFRDGERIVGASSATYVPVAADLGGQLTVRVTVTGAGHRRTKSPVSAPTARVTAAPVVPPPPVPPVPPVPAPTPTPTPSVPVVDVPAGLAAIVADLDVKGKPKVGSTVKVKGLDMVLRTAVSYRFQWFAGATKIKKATRSRLTITKAMRGRKVSVKVTARAASTTRSVTLKVGKVR